MNDFTKEELEIIRDGLDYLLHEQIMNNFGWPIFTKIKSLIDNYCEHESSIAHTMNVRKCIKCEEIF